VKGTVMTTPTAVSRRSVLLGGAGIAALSFLNAPTAALAAHTTSKTPAAGGLTDAQVYGVTTVNPLVERRADPFITRPVDGMYYFTGSVPEYDRLVVRGSSTIAGLATAGESVIWQRPASGQTGGHIWAPELHQIDGRWYMYFAAGDSDAFFNIRMYVMESRLADPRDPAGWGAPREVTTPWGGFKLDATTFEHQGRRYYVWAQQEPELNVNSSLYIAEMTSPFAIAAGNPVRISTPTLEWETRGFRVNEGPAVLIRNGRIFITYSASATDANYTMGMLTADADADLLDWASWVKSPQPVFTSNDQTQQYGPGHNSFTVAEDGVTDVLVYHARDYRDIVGDPLFDPNRHARVQKVYWHPDGTPLFGVPVGKGGPIVRLSPANAPDSHVRHLEFVARVDAGIRELADSQFRFVPGFAGDGTEAIQSVNFPDRYLVVDGTSVRIEQFQAGADFAGRASFTRRSTKNGISLQVADGTGRYLRHEAGTLTAGREANRRTTFILS
jgi:GH43 family beta-xylosidase